MSVTPSIASLQDFSPDSRVWVYQSDRPLGADESVRIGQSLDVFCRQWTAHNQQLKAAAEVVEGRYIILMVDETRAGASGCSIDKSVHFLEELGRAAGADFFERMRFGWLDEHGTLHTADRSGLSEAHKTCVIGEDTLMVNTMVQNKRDLQEKWLLPWSRSWHKRMV
ncbi:MAG: hypothetical protein ACKO4W_12005 [Bacteroidota bacterium]|jgi:hypothetical protein